MKGFTMIELIFVIVILGVLAAVAMPRLAATRDDAEIVKTAQNISTSLSDLMAYYTAKGEYSSNFSDMTKVPDKIVLKGKTCASYVIDNNMQITLTKGYDDLCGNVWALPGLKNIDRVYTSKALIIVQ